MSPDISLIAKLRDNNLLFIYNYLLIDPIWDVIGLGNGTYLVNRRSRVIPIKIEKELKSFPGVEQEALKMLLLRFCSALIRFSKESPLL